MIQRNVEYGAISYIRDAVHQHRQIYSGNLYKYDFHFRGATTGKIEWDQVILRSRKRQQECGRRNIAPCCWLKGSIKL